MNTFYRGFIPATVQTILPLYKALEDDPPKLLILSQPMRTTFENTKKALVGQAHPRYDAQTTLLATDASDYATGGVLQQSVHGVIANAISFLQQEFESTREEVQHLQQGTACALSCYSTFSIFSRSTYIQRCKRIRTIVSLTAVSLSYISEFTMHIQEKEHSVADAWSCNAFGSLADVHFGIDYQSMAKARKMDKAVQGYRTGTSSLERKDLSFGEHGITLLCDVYR